jgi:hypothetical protein
VGRHAYRPPGHRARTKTRTGLVLLPVLLAVSVGGLVLFFVLMVGQL